MRSIPGSPRPPSPLPSQSSPNSTSAAQAASSGGSNVPATAPPPSGGSSKKTEHPGSDRSNFFSALFSRDSYQRKKKGMGGNKTDLIRKLDELGSEEFVEEYGEDWGEEKARSFAQKHSGTHRDFHLNQIPILKLAIRDAVILDFNEKKEKKDESPIDYKKIFRDPASKEDAEKLVNRIVDIWKERQPEQELSEGMINVAKEFVRQYGKNKNLLVEKAQNCPDGAQRYPVKEEIGQANKMGKLGMGRVYNFGGRTFLVGKEVEDFSWGDKPPSKEGSARELSKTGSSLVRVTLPVRPRSDEEAARQAESALREIETIDALPKGKSSLPGWAKGARFSNGVVMFTEYLRGASAYDELREIKKFEKSEQLAKYRKMANALLKAVEDSNTHHRDLKLEHLRWSPERQEYILTAWKSASKEPNPKDYMRGTPGYFDPKVAAAWYDAAPEDRPNLPPPSAHAMDMRALGASLYCIATGRHFPDELTLLDDIEDRRAQNQFLAKVAGVGVRNSMELREDGYQRLTQKCRFVPFDEAKNTFWLGFDLENDPPEDTDCKTVNELKELLRPSTSESRSSTEEALRHTEEVLRQLGQLLMQSDDAKRPTKEEVREIMNLAGIARD